MMKAAKHVDVVQPSGQKTNIKEELIEIDVVDVEDPILIDDESDNAGVENGVEEWHGWEEQELTDEEIDIIRSNRMLTDISINCAQNILKKQFNVSGLQDTVLGQGLIRFREEKKRFCQILHNGSLHWVAVSNLNSPEDSIAYFDSLFHGRVKDTIKLQICKIMKCKSSTLTINVQPVQQQTNSVDCGIFSVAFMYYQLCGKNVSLISLDPEKLRAHFLLCLQNGIFTDFPETNSSTLERNPGKLIKATLFCSCKTIWLWYHGKDANMRMALCDKCESWYHTKCENICSTVFAKNNTTPWFCSRCK